MLDDVARLAEFADVLAVDVTSTPPAFPMRTSGVLAVERLGGSGRKRTLHANIAVNGDPQPGGGGQVNHQVFGAGFEEGAGEPDGIAVAGIAVAPPLARGGRRLRCRGRRRPCCGVCAGVT